MNIRQGIMEDSSPEYQYDAFVSYSSIDKRWVKDVLLPRLEANGLRACIDYRDFAPGSPSMENIERAIRASRTILVVITPAYFKSSWTGFEAIRTLTEDPLNRGRRLLPLVKEKCEFHLGFTPFTYLNFADPEDEGLEWERLLKAIREPPALHQSGASEVQSLLASLKAAFPNDEELRNLCFEHFGEIYRNLRETDRRDHIAREIITHCMSRGSTGILWDLIRQRNPQGLLNSTQRGPHGRGRTGQG
jgi:hypothetical protein